MLNSKWTGLQAEKVTLSDAYLGIKTQWTYAMYLDVKQCWLTKGKVHTNQKNETRSSGTTKEN